MSEDEYETEKGTKIKINVDTDKISKQVADIMSQQQAGKEEQALETFHVLKMDLANMMNDDSVLDCNTPNEVKDWVQKRTKRHVVSGKQVNRSGDSEEFGSVEELMDSIYGRAYKRGIPVQTEDGVKARSQINKLIEAFISGKPRRQMRERIAEGRHPLPESHKELWNCPKCNRTISSYPCGYCGYDPFKKESF